MSDPPINSSSTPPLVGRDEECARLLDAFHRAAAGSGAVALISGDAGLGKSRLAREITDMARESGVRAITVGVSEGGTRPFELLLNLLRVVRMGFPAARVSAETAATEFAANDADAATSRWAQVDATLDTLADASTAEVPLRVIAFEDLHWADASTLELLQLVLRQLDAIPLLVIGTFRPPGADATALLAFAGAVRALPYAQRIDLAPIDEAAAASLVRATGTIPEDQVASIVARADGNPFFLEEASRDATRAAREGGPAPRVPLAIREVMQRRASGLPERARDLLAALAVLDTSSTYTDLALVLGVAESEVVGAADTVVAHGIASLGDDQRMVFRHALARDAMYEWLLPARRRELHLRAAEAVQRRTSDVDFALVARHLALAGGVEEERRAADLLVQAAHNALAHLAYEQAAAHLQEVVALRERSGASADILLRARLAAASALSLTRSDDEILDTFVAIADAAAATADPEVEVRAAVAFERAYVQTGRPRTSADARSIPLLTRARSHLDASTAFDEQTRQRLLAHVLAHLAQAHFFDHQRDIATSLAAAAAEHARAAGDPAVEAIALNTQRAAMSGPDGFEERLALIRQAIAQAAAAGEADLELEGVYWQVWSLLELGRRSEAEASLTRFARLAERTRQPRRLSELHRMRGMFAHLAGDARTARAEADEAYRIAAASGNEEAHLYHLAQLAVLAPAAERRTLLREATADLAPWVAGRPGRFMAPHLLALAGDRARAARMAAMVFEAGLEQLDRDHMWLPLNVILAEAVIAVGEPRWAQELYDLLAPYADHYVVNSNGVCYGSLHRLLGHLASVVGSDRVAEHERLAAERNDLIGARAWLVLDQRSPIRVTRTFMFTDIVKSTNLAEAIGDEGWESLLRWHDDTLDALFRAHQGERVVSTGDGFFVAFEVPEDAMGCAVAIQRTLAEHRRTAGFAPQLRIGVHTAEATNADENYHGIGVHEAARIAALAGAGQIFASVTTAGMQPTKGAPWSATLKGLAEPVDVVELDW